MKSKQIISLLVGLFLLLSIPATIFLVLRRQELRSKAVPATVVSIQPTTLTKQPNETFSVTVAIDTGENTVSAAELVISFDSTKVEAQSLSAGDFLTTVLVEGNVTANSATITLGSPPTAPKKGTGTLARLSMKTKAALGNTQIGFDSATRVAGIGEQGDVLVGKTPGIVAIAEESAPTATPTPTPTPTPRPTSPPDPEDTTPTPSPTPIADNEEEDPMLTLTPTPTPTPAQQSTTSSGGNTTQVVYATATPTPKVSAGATLKLTSPTDGSVVKTNSPTFQGSASPRSTVTIVIFSEPVTGVVTADASGRWSYTPPEALPEGTHTVQITEQLADGTTRTMTAKITVQTTPIPVTGSTSMTMWIVGIGIVFLLTGIRLAYGVRP